MTDNSLRAFAEMQGFTLPAHYPLGQRIRFPAPGKNHSNKSAWLYVDNDHEFANFGNWITEESYCWFKQARNDKKFKDSEVYKKAQEQRKEASLERKKALEEQYFKAQEMAFKYLNFAQNNDVPVNHPYLKKKRIKPFGLKYMKSAQGLRDVLIVPIYGISEPFEGKIQSLQFIDHEGTKRFLSKAKSSAGYHIIHQPDIFNDIVICEGFATGATLSEHYFNQALVVCCFTANNLLPVAKYFKMHFPNHRFILAGDNDRNNDVNIGKAKAEKSAAVIGGLVMLPEFEPNQSKLTDWNDYYIANLGHGGNVV